MKYLILLFLFTSPAFCTEDDVTVSTGMFISAPSSYLDSSKTGLTIGDGYIVFYQDEVIIGVLSWDENELKFDGNFHVSGREFFQFWFESNLKMKAIEEEPECCEGNSQSDAP